MIPGLRDTARQSTCLGAYHLNSNAPNSHLVLSVFSLTWAICFRSKATPKVQKNIAFWHTWHKGRAALRPLHCSTKALTAISDWEIVVPARWFMQCGYTRFKFRLTVSCLS